jgi:AAA domain
MTEQSDFVRQQARAAEDGAGGKRPPPNGHGASGVRSCFTVRDWLNRNLPEPDFLMGQWASTTSRGLLVSDTGLGKTNLCLAIAFAMTLGHDFLHWRAGRPCRVIYIDGEMSRRLLKSRLTEATRRAGAVPDTLLAISRDDLPDMPPVNTEEGQRYIDELIEAVGGTDFIFFDNVQSLLLGDMRDEEPWQQTSPWIRDLTRRSIGQIWVHHTGHDKTRSYGTKTREWQLDTVILLEAVGRPGTDIAFTLKFTKARERAPHNRPDFDDVTITLSSDEWKIEGLARTRRAKPSPTGRKFFDALIDALAHGGAVHLQSAGQTAVTTRQWFDECVRRGLLDGSDDKRNQASNRAQISKYRRELVAAEWVACNGDLIWAIGQHR